MTESSGPPSCFVGMFDGHWGVTSAESCKQYYPVILNETINNEKHMLSSKNNYYGVLLDVVSKLRLAAGGGHPKLFFKGQ